MKSGLVFASTKPGADRASAPNDATARHAIGTVRCIEPGVAGLGVVSPRSEGTDRTGRSAGLASATGTGRLGRGSRRVSRQSDGTSKRTPEPLGVMTQQTDRRGPGPFGGERPCDEGRVGRPVRGKQGRAAPSPGKRADHPVRPTVEGVRCAVGILRRCGEGGPEVGIGTEQDDRLLAFLRHPEDREVRPRGLLRALRAGQRGQPARISEPAPWAVNSSRSVAFGTRPSRMTTARTPCSTA